MNLMYKLKTYVSVVLLSLLLSACVDLTAVRFMDAKKSRSNASQKNLLLEKGEVHTMRGGLGIFSMGMNQLQTEVSQRFNIPSDSSMWYNAGHVSKAIVNYHYQQQSRRPVILIGHSLGANEQIKVARNLNKVGIPVALLVTIDAVSTTHVPPNVKKAFNVYKPGFVPMFSGLKLVADKPKLTQIENINVNELKNIRVNHFTIDKDKIVQTMILDEISKVLNNANKKQV